MTRVWRGPPETRELARLLRDNLTHSERVLWARVKDRALGVRFRQQHPVGGYVADLYAPSITLDVEIDGTAHDDREELDAVRDLSLARRGVYVVRFSADDVENRTDDVVARLREIVAQRMRN